LINLKKNVTELKKQIMNLGTKLNIRH